MREDGGNPTTVWARLARARTVVQIGVDWTAWSVAVVLTIWLRYSRFMTDPLGTGGIFVVLPMLWALQAVVGILGGQYRGRWRYGSFEEVAALARGVVVVTAVVTAVNRLVSPPRLPASVLLGSGMVAFVLMGGARYAFRLSLERRLRPSARARRLLVFGAGEGGFQIVSAMLRTPDSPFVPVAVLDDDPAKRNLRIKGIRVVGTRDDIPQAAQRFRASAILIAIPSARSELIRELTERAERAGLQVHVLPAVGELLGHPLELADIRPVSEEDLLGRHRIETDVVGIAGYIGGSRVLVTGAGGSIGSELCRQISRFSPARLVMLDRDETALYQVQLSLAGARRSSGDDSGNSEGEHLVVCDIRDQEDLRRVFARHRPEVVFHAAALKHLPLLELHPREAVKTNVLGTLNVLRASLEFGVGRFVNVSTDKAADPTSVLGYTKRVAERLTAAANEVEGSGVYLSVRFGNVLGSRGSVLEAFKEQIRRGGPVTVTHPEVTRYFMTVQEACELVIQAGAVGRRGEALVLDMGDPVRIVDVARRLVAASGRDIPIEFTGLRPGEKLHEVLFGEEEVESRRVHPAISHVDVPPLAFEEVEGLDDDPDPTEELRRLTTSSPRRVLAS